MKLFRLLESFDGNEQVDGWQDKSGATASSASVGGDAHNAAYNILELTPAQRQQLAQDGELSLDTAGGGVTYIRL